MAIRKPKRAKPPRKPKKSASNETKKRYLERHKEWERSEAEKVKRYHSELKTRKELDAKIYR